MRTNLICSISPSIGRISNNRGRINGWTGYERVYGICTHVEGKPRGRALDKTLTKGRD